MLDVGLSDQQDRTVTTIKVFLTAAIAIVLSLAVVGPAAAQEMNMCPHAATIEALASCVEHAREQGPIDNQGVTRGLLAKLDAAAAALERDQPAVAVNILAAFVNQLEAQDGQHIVAPHAGHLQMHAQMVIDALSQ